MQRHYPQAPISAVAALVISEGRVLLILRRNPPSAGQWSVPGGVQELGEPVIEAVRREVREETGLEIADLRLLDVGDILLHDAEGRIEYHYVITYYLAHPARGQLRAGDDVGDARWVALDEIAALELSPRLLELVSMAVSVDAKAMNSGPLCS